MKLNQTISLQLLIISVLLLVSKSLSAQLSINGEFRPRTEFRNGYRALQTSGSDPAFFTSQRTRLNFLFDNDRYQIGISAQDVRIWGDEAQLRDNANMNIHEAWAELRATDQFKVKIGRQELVYDDQRLLGSVNWSQIGRSHDAILVKYQNKESELRLDMGAAYNQENEALSGNTYSLNNYKVLSYLWMNKQLGELDLSAILLTDGFETASGNINYRYTYGTVLDYKPGDLLATGAVYFQRGDDKIRTDISACMIAGKVSYTISDLNLSGGIDYLSGGDKNDANPSQYSFNTLYATNHKFYGGMDYFLNIPVDTRGGGLQDIYLKLVYTFTNDLKANVTGHTFSLANEIISPSNSSEILNRRLGSELDLSASYRFGKDIHLNVGYSILLPTDSLELIQQRSARGLQQWGWVSMVLTPEFITGE